MIRVTLFSFLSLLMLACGGDDGGDGGGADAGADAASGLTVLGTWESDPVTTLFPIFRATLSGEPTTGAAEIVRSVAVAGDTPSCRSERVGIGTFVVTGTSMTIDTPTALQRTVGCTSDTETPIDPGPAQGFAGELSGEFILTGDFLQLGLYPPLFSVD